MKGSKLSCYLHSSVFNIKDSSCNIPLKIILDTNVLLWAYYPRISLHPIVSRKPYSDQLKYYPEFLEKLLEAKSKLFVHELNIFEFINKIERFEFEILYCTKNNVYELRRDFNLNQLKIHNSAVYQQIKKEINTYLEQIIGNFTIKCCKKSINYLREILRKWSSTYIDIKDSVIISDSKILGIDSFLSDDQNFCTHKGIKLYTANENVINARELKEKKKRKK